MAKVLHYVASLRGGAAVVALELARRLPAEGIDCALAAPFDNPAMKGRESQLGARVHLCRDRAALLRILAWERPAILHCHGHRAAWTGRRVRGDVKIAVTYHGFHVPHYRTGMARLLVGLWENHALARTHLVIFVSEEDRRTAEAWLHGTRHLARPPFHVIANGIDVERFRRENVHPVRRAELNLADGDFVIGYVGRFHRQKSPGTLLCALAELRADLPAARLLMLGDGPLEADLRRRAKRADLSDRVRFLPPRADVERLYPCMDALALPSLWEGLPLALLEAGAAGVPVVASDAPGIRELVAHETTGLFFPAGDASALSRALVRLARDPALAARMAAALLKRVEENHTVQRMVRDHAALYRTVL